jgi:hypothetical protein
VDIQGAWMRSPARLSQEVLRKRPKDEQEAPSKRTGTHRKVKDEQRRSTPMKRKMTCGAHARSTGRPCQAMALLNGRCRNHGGCSSGPKTQAGRAAISAAAKARMTPEHKKRLSDGFQRWLAGGGRAWLSKLATARFRAKRRRLSVRVAPAPVRTSWGI